MKFTDIRRHSRFALFVALCLLTLSGCSMLPHSHQSTTAGTIPGCTGGDNLYDDYMAQERQWAGLTTKRVEVRKGLEIVYSEGGNPNAPVLLLLHGYYGDRNDWNEVAHLLGNRYHLIIPDLPGHGDSSPNPDNKYSFAEMTLVLEDFLDKLHIRHFYLAGHSMGGGIAIQMTMSREPQIDGLILIDSAGKYRDNTSPVMQQILAGDSPLRIAKPGDGEKVAEIAMALPPFIPAKVMHDFECKQLQRTAVYDKVMSDMLNSTRKMDPGFFDIPLKMFHKPALVIWGDKDSIFSVNVTQQLMDALPDATLVIIHGVGHTPIMEAPWPTAQAIKTFMDARLHLVH